MCYFLLYKVLYVYCCAFAMQVFPYAALSINTDYSVLVERKEGSLMISPHSKMGMTVLLSQQNY